MLNLQIKIEGLDSLKKALEKAPEDVVNEVSKALEISLNDIRNQALREAPVNKQTGGGNLRQKILPVKMLTRLRGEIESAAGYSVYVHEGTKPHIITIVNKKVLANRRKNQIFGKVVHHPGTQPNPFLKRAIDKSSKKVENNFRMALIRVIKKISS